jgi:NAD(P)-dependent dehydrogenase (short-subunit alcohol dehydrogenase family)
VTAIDRFHLDGKVAVVTGASSGLGVHVALAEAGADVAVAGRHPRRLDEAMRHISELDRKVLAGTCDITDPESCDTLAWTSVDCLGRIDVLVNNAGIAGDVVPPTRETPDHFRQVIDTNLNGPTGCRRPQRAARFTAGAWSRS